jgi:hypothetical protein
VHIPGWQSGAEVNKVNTMVFAISMTYAPSTRALHHPDQGVDRTKIHSHKVAFKERKAITGAFEQNRNIFRIVKLFMPPKMQACPSWKRK